MSAEVAAGAGEETNKGMAYVYALRSPAGVTFHELRATIDPASATVPKPVVRDLAGLSVACSAPEHALFSDDGCYHAVATDSCVLVRAVAGSWALEVPVRRVVRMAFSPRGTYLVTWARQEQPGAKNLLVWAVRAAAEAAQRRAEAPVAAFVRKVAAECVCWPLLCWSGDERYCARVCAECVEVVPGDACGSTRPLLRLGVRGVGLVDWCPVPHRPRAPAAGSDYLLGVFCRPHGTEPGFVAIYDADPSRGKRAAREPLSQRSFARADSCSIKWNPAAARGQPQALLATVESDQDASGMSYYGESSLYILFADKPHLNGLVPLRKKGNIHDVAWAPNGKLFAVVSGYMPAMTAVYEMQPNGHAVLRASLGPLARNVVRFSPDSRLLFVGGFGNLAGDMDLFDTDKFAVVGRANAHTTTQWEWSPDGAFICCAVTAPRRHVDNGFHLFAVNGQLVLSVMVPELYDFAWQPAPETTRAALESPPPRPKAPADTESRAGIPHTTSLSPAAAAAAAEAAAAMPAGKYVPPHMRAAAAAKSAQQQQQQQRQAQQHKEPSMKVYARDGTVQKQKGGEAKQQPQAQKQQQQAKPKPKKQANPQMCRRGF